jgi:hypothetical protein
MSIAATYFGNLVVRLPPAEDDASDEAACTAAVLERLPELAVADE